MPCVEMATSPEIQSLIQAFKCKTDGGKLSREYMQGKKLLWNTREENSAKLNRTRQLMTQGLSFPKPNEKDNYKERCSPFTNILMQK